jgi:hypothetical protein
MRDKKINCTAAVVGTVVGVAVAAVCVAAAPEAILAAGAALVAGSGEAAVYLAYRFLHIAMGGANRLVGALTYIRYYRRYHASGVAIKDIKRK